MALEQIDDQIWVKAVPHKFVGLHLGSRMTVVRLPSGALWVHSPVPIDSEDEDKLRELGPVRHIVAPNLFHHVYAGTMAEKFNAELHAPAGLRKKRKDLRIDSDLGPRAPEQWDGVLSPVHISGTMLDEVVYVHKPSKTLITADLLENFETSEHLLTRLYLKAAGLHGKPNFSRFLRIAIRKRALTRTAIEALLKLSFDRVILAHGKILANDGKSAIEAAYAWL